MTKPRIQVLKFGSSVLKTEQDLPKAVGEIYRWWRQGYAVVAVVSALDGRTDVLFRQANDNNGFEGEVGTAEWVATGEAEAVALLQLACQRAGLPSRAWDAARLGLRLTGPVLDAKPAAVDVARLRRQLQSCPILVVPGYVGLHQEGHLALLGRGGSDLSAVYLAQRLNGRCRLLKDFPGIFQWDPHRPGPAPKRLTQLPFDRALAVGGQVLQAKAVHFARQADFPFEVSACGHEEATLVGADRLEEVSARSRKESLPVSLWGLGTVGSGVFERLQAHPDQFQIGSILIKDPAKTRPAGISPNQLRYRPEDCLDGEPGVVVDVTGGGCRDASWRLAAVQQGWHFVTADKELLSEHGEALRWEAEIAGVSVRASAAVGGALPALEWIRRIAEGPGVASMAGVLNGTCNFLLNELAAGCSWDSALEAARERGFAEADSREDLSGRDAARKLFLLAQQAWPQLQLPDGGIFPSEALEPKAVDPRKGLRIRQVARASLDSGGRIKAGVRLEPVGAGHPWFELPDQGNGLQLWDRKGAVYELRGAGAGCRPTTEAVIADLWDLWRQMGRACRLEEVGS
ncbi:MAG: hypothetical protein DWQ01_06575 [Planctomycetota bacterium]|nr:MAG: hypothetical protein DWQ01_06575 [Planctomycetota bacterium]